MREIIFPWSIILPVNIEQMQGESFNSVWYDF